MQFIATKSWADLMTGLVVKLELGLVSSFVCKAGIRAGARVKAIFFNSHK